jgi:hypothetical protein
MKALTVITPFADYPKGHQITDEKEMADILEGHNVHHVVKITLVDRKAADNSEGETA